MQFLVGVFTVKVDENNNLVWWLTAVQHRLDKRFSHRHGKFSISPWNADTYVDVTVLQMLYKVRECASLGFPGSYDGNVFSHRRLTPETFCFVVFTQTET